MARTRGALDVVLALFAPFLPFVTEEVWSHSHDGSIHRSRWPDSEALGVRPEANAAHLDAATTVLHEIRKAKSAAKVSLRTAVSELTVHASADHLRLLRAVIDDIREAGNVAKVSTLPSDNGPGDNAPGDSGFRVEVELESAATG